MKPPIPPPPEPTQSLMVRVVGPHPELLVKDARIPLMRLRNEHREISQLDWGLKVIAPLKAYLLEHGFGTFRVDHGDLIRVASEKEPGYYARKGKADLKRLEGDARRALIAAGFAKGEERAQMTTFFDRTMRVLAFARDEKIAVRIRKIEVAEMPKRGKKD
jgi:hypothetical protein